MSLHKLHGIMAKFFTLGKTMQIRMMTMQIRMMTMQIRMMTMQIRMMILSLICILSLTHCASYDFSRRVVQQGNLLPQSKIERLKLGMNKEDAAILMGTSLLSPMFNDDRWDYAYTWRKGNGHMQVKNVSLYFRHGALARIENHS